jgi:two-component system, NarL family, nitrate/nitrite response regulator NarL
MSSAPAPKTVRLLVIDDHALFREGLSRILDAEEGFEVVADAPGLAEGLRIVRTRPVDLVLLDLELQGERGVDFIPRARADGYAGKILVVTAEVSPREVLRLIEMGVSGVFLKLDPPEVLAARIRQVMTGELGIDATLLRSALRTPDASAPKALTPRERQVLRHILSGLTSKEIADRVGSSEAAVKGVLQQLFHKTGVRSRAQLVRVAMENYRRELELDQPR